MGRGVVLCFRRVASRAVIPGAVRAMTRCLPIERTPQVSDSRNLILAVVLSALVLLGWTLISDRYLPAANPTPQTYQSGREVVKAEPNADPAADSPAAIRDRKAVLAETTRVTIDTPRLAGSINLKGARIDDLLLKNYHETIKKGSPNIRLFSPSGAPDAYFAQFGWSGAGVPPADAVWTASATTLSPAEPVTLSWTSPTGAVFEIVLAIDNDFLFTVTQRVVNRSGAALAVRPYGLVARVGESKDPSTWTTHVGPMGVFNDRTNYDVGFKDLKEGATPSFASRGGWAGFTDKYWLTALVAATDAPVEAHFRHAAGDRFQTDLSNASVTVAPGRAGQSVTRLFAGAKEVPLLDRYKSAQGIQQFDKAIDWGWFYFITKPIFYLLDFLFKLFGNFGVAIMGLTLIVKLIMFPIANKQYASMTKMRVLQPKMKALQERHKDDKARQQQEVMALYAKEKVNPLGGCLPIVLQIPVFYSLYKVLMLTIEMRHQPFVAWIKDLSAPDPLTPINLFGLLPFTPPHLISLGVLAIILGITMWIQQKLNPMPVDPAQAQVMAIMPWVFMFVMASFAAGLQLYWITNNLISIGQQKLFMHRYPVPAA